MRLRYDKGRYIYLEYYDDRRGHPNSFSLKIPNNSTGKVEAKRILKDYERGVKSLPSKEVEYKPELNIKLSEAWRIYLSKTKLASSTLDVRGRAVKHLMKACGDKPLRDYEEDQENLMKYLSYLSHNSQAIFIGELHSFFKYHGMKPFKMIQRKEKPVKIIPEKHLITLLQYYKTLNIKRYYILLYLFLTGQRKSDACNLKWEMVDWENEVLDLSNLKGGREYTFPLTNDLRGLFELMGVQRSGRVFSYSISGMKFFEKDKHREDYPLKENYTIHQFRKTFITLQLERGMTLKEVQKLVDHRKEQTTIRYYQYVEAKKSGEKMNQFPSIFPKI